MKTPREAFTQWRLVRGVEPMLTHLEIFEAGWYAYLAAIKDEAAKRCPWCGRPPPKGYRRFCSKPCRVQWHNLHARP